MLMSLDQFVFGLDTAAYQELQRRTSWKHPTTSRVGGRNARQYTGQGDDTITLSGMLAPDQFGKLESLTELRKMADAGDAYVLVDGAGRVYGAFVIEGMNEGQTLHMKDGTPRRIEFSLDLARVDDGLVKTRTDPKKDETQ
ncbi:phage tail protein [Paraburkholderia aspalathi]|uniref:phage tail protein n=1 Tax=Paraburkholderia aspalathi TaxID=1324617 RepID=UPI0038B751B8